ncbi:Lactaldehyde dehydrogenase [Listeria grayi]|uniref:Aldehyde dehydrogenase n=3 Tax=Listeria grayi TaxID=1641 RepID=D7UX69_LISGR|nr:aldehyde dehydrogenase (NAD) family protein [Listeria grayi DSM 20601]EUJ26275.1 hypothetical protein LMUR_13784 [Listeria grayi FSL F6-1183]STY45329.1 Lactaldehyde dehydrogenase [Listeria grayi]VEI32077.1 Lactaldehyde dehydrogenase [Listeria grayi]
MMENYINGKFVLSHSDKTKELINPVTEKFIETMPQSNEQDVNEAIAGAKEAQKEWAKKTMAARSEIVKELKPILEENKEELAKIYVEEQGKTFKEAIGEIERSIQYIDYMAGFAYHLESEVVPSEIDDEMIVFLKKPIGIVGGILPWNAPVFVLMRKLIPALIAGCSVVIKPSNESPLNTLKIAEYTQRTSLPTGLFQVVVGSGSEVGNQLSKHPDIDLISITGSTGSGKAVMKAAAETVKKVNLELGGKAPTIVTEHADLQKAVRYIVQARIKNSGQVCTCPERVYVHENVAEAFTKELRASMEKLQVGDPYDEKTDYGSIINKEQLDHISELVAGAEKEGAKILIGGNKIDRGKGYFFEPTIITNATQDMEIMNEEIFGPVVPIMTYKTFDEVIDLANDSVYGLSSYLFSENYREIMRGINEIRFGEVYVNCEAEEAINGFHAGFRESGLGGADGRKGFEEFLQTTVAYLRYE